MGNTRSKVVVVGGGITGLSTAFYVNEALRENGLEAEVTLLEKSGRVGGRIQTLRRDGFVIEKGPDSFLARKLPIIDLTRALGLEDELVGTNPNAKKTYILHHGKLHRMPQGLVLGIPTEWTPFLSTGLISPGGKARAALDLVLPKRTDPADESLGHFITRRLGREVLENIAEPLLAGIYAGDTYKLSLAATFPQFRAVEQKKRSLVLGMTASRKEGQALPGLPAAAQKSVFLTYRNGLSTLVERLEEVLGGLIRKNCGVRTLHDRKPDGSAGYTLELESGETLEADVVLLTQPAPVVSRLLGDLPEAAHLAGIQYVSVANVILAFDGSKIPLPLDGTGYVIPRKEPTSITACTWTSTKWLHTAPSGKVLLRCYVGRSGAEQWVNWSDEELLAHVRADLRRLHGIDAEPMFHEITRLPHSMPQYPVGHLDALRRLRERLAADRPGLFVAGAALEGVGIPDCVRQGRDAAKTAVGYLRGLR